MTVIKGFDCGGNTMPYARALAADGMRFAGRYLTRGDDGRTLHLPEVERLHEAGIAVILIFQHRNNNPGYFTEQNARIDVDRALIRAAALKVPAHVGINFAVDTDATAANEHGILDYARIVWAEMQKTKWLQGWYGDDRVIQRLLEELDAGHIAYFANAKGWREAAIPDSWDILQKPERRHFSGLMIDDCEIEFIDDEETSLRSVGAWVP